MMDVDDMLRIEIPTRPPSIREVWEKLLQEENGLERYLTYIRDGIETLREEMETAYLRDNRQGAVKAGMLRGFRLATEIAPEIVLNEIRAAKERDQEGGDYEPPNIG